MNTMDVRFEKSTALLLNRDRFVDSYLLRGETQALCITFLRSRHHFTAILRELLSAYMINTLKCFESNEDAGVLEQK